MRLLYIANFYYMHRERKWLYCFCNTLNHKEHHKRSKRSCYSGTRPDFSVICKSSKIAPQNGQHNLPSVQRGTKVATGQFLYSFICHQKKGIKMLQQYVRSNIRTSGKELFRLSLFYHDPLVDFQCLLKILSPL